MNSLFFGSALGGGFVPVSRHAQVPKAYEDVARRAAAAFPEPVGRVFREEGVTLVLSSGASAANSADSVSPFEYVPSKSNPDKDVKQVTLSPLIGNDWASEQQFYWLVLQQLAQVLRASNIEMLFDDGFENAFANDFESLDTRLGMFMQGTGLADDPTTQESTRVREFRQKMAESQGGLEQMLEAVGWCIAEQCTGESPLNEIFVDVERPVESFFPELSEAVRVYQPKADSMARGFLDRNPDLAEKLSQEERDLLENLLADPTEALHTDKELQVRYADFAGRAMGLLMEDVFRDDRYETFVQPFENIRDTLLTLLEKLHENAAVVYPDETIKLVSCLERTELLLGVLGSELPKENRYENDEVREFFCDLVRESEESEYQFDATTTNIYDYVATVIQAFIPEGQEQSSLVSLYMLATRLEASGNELAARSCEKLVGLLESKLGVEDA